MKEAFFPDTMSTDHSPFFLKTRADVLHIVAAIPSGHFTTYGSIARHLGINPRQVARVMSRLTEEEATTLPWHRVVGANARISPHMDATLAAVQRQRLTAEGMTLNRSGFIQNDEVHFHVVRTRTSG